MASFTIEISQEAKNDIDSIIDFIFYEYKAPITAKRYYDGLFNRIVSLSTTPLAFPLLRSTKFTQLGYFTRRINYKKFAILYTVNNNTVLILRVIPQSLL